ncbi:lytic transglycosylase domain-containing protein [Methylocaldum sp.]|uniref:lytic transglycosylase domain-containing protein n=1 Tax=Methylocaldum sp. TaxID=1969727 RepID=UPI002D4A5EBA|nr:lytic transglycosylase domain-containing protein [Methylocaldum sp.]HYE37054.1 lytic transglycosylase domain-containing protein [Methylocaldum sp.]
MFRPSKIRRSLAFLSFLFPGVASTDVYKYVDSAGHVFYTDNPRHSGYQRIIKTPAAFLFYSPSKKWPSGSGFSEKNRRQFASLIDAAASKYSLDPALLHAVIRAESSYNPEAVSNKGAVGLMQLMPETAARYGVRDRYDPGENIEGGAKYLSELIGMFQSDVRLAVAAYNAGENNVIKYGNKVPPFQETQQYVARVLNYYNRFN